MEKKVAKRTGLRMRIKTPKRRTPSDRLRSRLYYRKHRSKIRLQRRRYLKQHKTVLKRRKLFQRFKPVWFKKRKSPKVIKPKKLKLFKPHVPKIKKIKKP